MVAFWLTKLDYSLLTSLIESQIDRQSQTPAANTNLIPPSVTSPGLLSAVWLLSWRRFEIIE